MEERGTDCCGSDCCASDCSCRGMLAEDSCRVEAVIRLDRRGQMVLPKEVREAAGFRPDQNLAVVSWRRDGAVCCVSLQVADDLADAVHRRFGPLFAGTRVHR